MTKKLYDISEKIDKYRLEIIAFIKETCDSLNIPFFIVGATARDVIDLVSLIESYLDAGNFDRLSDEESDLIKENFDYIFTGARLLGRDIAKNFQKGTLKFLMKILDDETAENDRYRLVEEMMKSKSIREEKDFNYFLKLLQNIKLGLSDRY